LIRSDVYSSVVQPRGYLENIVRLRKANEEKRRINEIRKTQGQPKHYTGELTKPMPFNLQTESIGKRGAPTMVIEVSVGAGKTGIIGVHPGDNPRQLAANFCKIYHLDDAAEEGLYKIILENMDDVSPEKNGDEDNEIIPIQEAREGDEQTSNITSNNYSKTKLQNKSKTHSSNNTNNNSSVQNRSQNRSQNPSQNRSQNMKVYNYSPEQNQEDLNSFNKQHESGYDMGDHDGENYMMDGEDVNYRQA